MTTLVANGPPVSRVGLGLLEMSALYGPRGREGVDRNDPRRRRRGHHTAGHRLLLRMGHNELLPREALCTINRDRMLISVKFGALRDPNGMHTCPAAIKNFVAYSLSSLGTDHINVYRPTRLDPTVPDRGHGRRPGRSRPHPPHRPVRDGRGTIRRAQAVHPITDLQIEYSLLSRGIESETLPTTRELGISITAYGVLSRGLLSGH